MSSKIAIILGTRPEIIKQAPLIRECETRGLPYIIIHSGQHYDAGLDKVFFQELKLPEPHYNLNVGSAQHIDQLASMMQGLVPIFKSERPGIILVQGDTNTVLAAALVASRLGIPIGHVEAGLRSYDRAMPEEINRIIADHLAEWLFCPTELQKNILLKEGFESKKIFVTGNTIVDSVLATIDLAKDKTNIILDKNNITPNNFFLLTCHRPSNTDNDENLMEILHGVSTLAEQEGVACLFPVHPRLNSKKHLIEEFPKIKIISPVGYLESIVLQSFSRMIFTDSGGIQEESCILKKKCIVLSTTTERPEALQVGGARLLPKINRREIISTYTYLIDKDIKWTNPFGDGKASSKIISILLGEK
jgi:UDP-N-acetylglucosamine 2-epimerase (non-hydrolysing)